MPDQMNATSAPAAASQEPVTLADGVPDDAEHLLRQMLRIRVFEDEVKELFTQGLVRGSTHLGQGQEAVSVGACAGLGLGDTMTCTYRGHGAVLAMGAPVDRCFGELLGKANGLCGGKGGSMHFTDASVGAIGSNAIVGAHLPVTVGADLAAEHLGTGAVSIAFLGDGATNIGAFHESLNLAAIWRLPAIFLIENNHYGEYSPLASTTPVERLARRADSYGMAGVHVDGNDVVAVRSVTRTAVQRARAGEDPTLIEADTYRQQGHSRSDPGAYRPPGELEAWLARDPIVRLEQALEAVSRATPDQLARLRAEVSAEVAEASARAQAWPEPSAASLLEDVYA